MAVRKEIKKDVPVDRVKFSFVDKNGVKVYPVNENGKWYIEANNNGTIKRFAKEIKQSEINEMTVKTIDYYYKLLKDKENGVNKGNNNTRAPD